MATPDQITLDTIDKCSLLLKYAAETITEKDKKAAFVSAAGQIETCKDANANNQWSPSIAGQFCDRLCRSLLADQPRQH